jgi:hypothetical protein
MQVTRVDRLEAWLHRQAGWRLAVLVWLQVCPLTILMGVSAWSFFAPGSPGLSLTAALLSLIVAVPFAWLFIAARRRRPERRPVLFWRGFAGSMCLLAGFLLTMSSLNDPASRHHRAVALASFVMDMVGCGFFLDAARRRLSRRTA